MKTSVQQLFIGLTEDATERLEALLAQQTCAVHIHTTLDATGDCAMCALDLRQHQQARADEAMYALQAVLAPSQWPDEPQPEWVKRARAFSLPAKVLSS